MSAEEASKKLDDVARTHDLTGRVSELRVGATLSTDSKMLVQISNQHGGKNETG